MLLSSMLIETIFTDGGSPAIFSSTLFENAAAKSGFVSQKLELGPVQRVPLTSIQNSGCLPKNSLLGNQRLSMSCPLPNMSQ